MSPQPLSPFQRFLDDLRPEVDSTLESLLPEVKAEPGRLHGAMRYSVFAGGKRVRPALLILAGEAFGAPRDRLLPGAAAVEMIHTFSLVHDDLPALDDDDLRRGKATVHRAYDEALAILAGDALLNLGLSCLCRFPTELPPAVRLRAVELAADAVGTGGMIGGQVADLESERSWPDDPAAVLERIHQLKTGALLTAALRLGGLYAGVEAEEDEVLTRLGRGIGLLFQIGDDILDVEGTTAALGKTAGKDERAEKLTYPRVFGFEGSKEVLRKVHDETLAAVDDLNAEGDRFRSLISYLTTRDR